MVSLTYARFFILGTVFLTILICNSSSESNVKTQSPQTSHDDQSKNQKLHSNPKSEEAENVLNNFLCALKLIRQSIQKFHDRIISEVVINGQLMSELEVLPPVPAFIFKAGKDSIINMLPKNQSEDSINRSLNFYRKFYNGLWFGQSDFMKTLLSNLSYDGYEKFKFSAVLAGFYELAGTYCDSNSVQAMRTYIASIKEDDARSILEIIRQYNNWNLVEEDMKMINVCLMTVGYRKIAYQTMPRPYGYIKLALPLQDPNEVNGTCV